MDKRIAGDRKAIITALILSSLAIIIQTLFLIDEYLGGGVDLTSKKNPFISQIYALPLHAHLPLLFFLFILFAVYALYSGIVYYFVLFLQRFWVKNTGSIILTLRCWIISYTACWVLNCYLYPNSFFSWSFFNPASIWPLFGHLAVYTSIAVLAIFIVGAMIIVAQRMAHHPLPLILVFIILVSIWAGLTYHRHRIHRIVTNNATSTKPNVIIIYYCSFKTDALMQLPNFQAFAEKSVWFKNVFSPVARSEPSTYAFLSGLYPATSHEIENLNWNDPQITYHNLLPEAFNQAGYQTLFITNNAAFRRLDSKLNWGFQNIVTPKSYGTSFYAAILAKLNDYPITNLLFEFMIDEFLFPENYYNNDDIVHYFPERFLRVIEGGLSQHLNHKPLFLMINDESLHFPYMTAVSLPLSYDARYKLLSKITDDQFAQYLSLLNQYHLLDHAILILSADHGESHNEDPNTVKLVASLEKVPMEHQLLLKTKMHGNLMTVGHGAFALDKGQYHVPLVFHFYGVDSAIAMPQTHHSLYSTVDVAPTLRDFFHFSTQKTDGFSLLPIMMGQSIKDDHLVYVNSGAYVTLPSNPQQVKETALDMMPFYDLNKAGGIGLKVSFLKQLAETMQIGVYWKDFELVYFPVLSDDKIKINSIAFFAIMNDQSFDIEIVPETKMQEWAMKPDEAVLRRLKMTPEELRFMVAHVLEYRKKMVGES